MALGERLGKRVLAFYPSSRGFGFVMFDGARAPLEWGTPKMRATEGEKLLAKLETLIRKHGPEILAIESVDDPACRRRERVRTLLGTVATIASVRGIGVVRVAKADIVRAFEAHGAKTKRQVAVAIAETCREFAPRLPPPAKKWESEGRDARMSIFGAVALATAFYLGFD